MASSFGAFTAGGFALATAGVLAPAAIVGAGISAVAGTITAGMLSGTSAGPNSRSRSSITQISPVYQVKEEARRIWAPTSQNLKSNLVKCYVSIGQSLNNDESLSRYFTQPWSSTNPSSHFFHFSIEGGQRGLRLDNILDDQTLEQRIQEYLDQKDQQAKLDESAARLHAKKSEHFGEPSSDIRILTSGREHASHIRKGCSRGYHRASARRC